MVGGPDISVWVKIDGEVVWKSAVAEDRFSFNYRAIVIPRVLASESDIAFTVMDVDVAESDTGGRAQLDLSQVRDVPADGKALTLQTANGVTLTVAIVPAQ